MSEINQVTTKSLRVAVPSEQPGGLTASSAGYFGRCSHFTIADLRDGEATDVLVLENPPHHEGGCMQPVLLLAEHMVDAIIVNGIGGRPLAGFNQLGIAVFAGDGSDVDGTLRAFAAGRLSPVGPESVCRH